MRKIAFAALILLLPFTKASALELLLSVPGPINYESSVIQDPAIYDWSGDGRAELLLKTGDGYGDDQSIIVMNPAGEVLATIAVVRSEVCPSCSSMWVWELVGFGDIEGDAGRESVVAWDDISTESLGVAVLARGTNSVLANFDGADAEALYDFTGDGQEDLLLRYWVSHSEQWSELWGLTDGVAVPQGAPVDSASALLTGLNSYPNPSRDGAGIAFELQRDTVLSLAIADISGRLVRKLGAGPRARGHYEIAWDGKDDEGRRLPAGCYFFVAEGGGQTAARKLIALH